ncbi:MAG: type VI secretion system tip protein VgrG, partial [Xanthomonadaceae bacterium]|nr:type VI secretion system tip protein VgrG [Xanthomonadaceae bacterium]
MYGEVALLNSNWMKYQQDHRTIRIKTALDEDLFVVSRFQGADRVSGPFSYTLELLSPDARLELKQLIGQPVQLFLETDRGDRFFHGYVKEFARTGASGDVVSYCAELAPWFDFLQHTGNCRIFQNKNVQEIIDEVFKAYLPLADYRYELNAGTYPKLDYCVQYNESDFHFVSRLLEDAGIYYAFEHGEDKHTMVLSDNSTIAPAIGHVATVRYRLDDDARMDYDLEQWRARRRVGADTHTLGSFDFKQPRSSLLSDSAASIPRGMLPQLERYSYDGAARFLDSRIGDMLAHVRSEEAAWPTKLFEGEGSCRHVYTGGYFQLEGHFDHTESDATEREFFVVEVHHEATNNFNTEVTDGHAAGYRCALTALRRKIAFRPLRQTPRQRMPGPQTATVVGPPGEELYADRYGRVKVQFHWDR